MSKPVLETQGLTIRFGGHAAVDNVSCAFHAGSLTAIVGPNGAGKTTYFNLMSGQLPATAGSVRLDGDDVTRLSTSERAKRGIGRAFQITSLFPNLSVAENIRLAVQAKARAAASLWSRWDHHVEWINRAEHFLEEVSLQDKRDIAAAALPHLHPDRRRSLLQSISESAATAPGWSTREPVFWPEWVEKVDIAAAA